MIEDDRSMTNGLHDGNHHKRYKLTGRMETYGDDRDQTDENYDRDSTRSHLNSQNQHISLMSCMLLVGKDGQLLHDGRNELRWRIENVTPYFRTSHFVGELC
jgi:hypothetical protein